jgi:peptide/nickel transport system substrate-binding protein
MKYWTRGSILSLAVGAALGVCMAIANAAPSGTFKFAEEVKLISLDPQQLSGGGISYMRPVYETLFRVGPEDRLEPLLATGYEVDGLKVKFMLRKDVKFSDGELFNAKAVVANIERGVKLAIQPALKPIAKVEATGEYEVTVTLNEPSPSLIRSLASAPGMMISPKALEDPALDRNPVGTGPYLYDKAQSREGEVRVYTPNPNYWAPDEVGLERLEIWEMTDDTARLNALKTGQVDIGIWLTNPQSAIIDKTPGLKLIRNIGGNTYHIVISDREGAKVPAFADKRVRQAMNYAIDREAFSKAVDFGLSVPAYQPYPKGAWEHEPSLEGSYAYNPDKARELMKEAGYADGFSFDMPSIPIFQSRLEALAGFFKDIGITMNLVTVEPGTLARRSRTTDFPATNLVWNITLDPSYLTIRFIAQDGAFNPFKVKPSETLTKLGDEGMQSEDTDVRASIYRKMAEQLADESYLIFVTSNPVLFGVREEVTKNPTLKYRPGEDTIYFRGLRVKN